MPKKTFDEASWQAKLAQARVPKEDMNRLIMNFLVTEVCKPRQVWICRWKQTCCEGHAPPSATYASSALPAVAGTCPNGNHQAMSWWCMGHAAGVC